MYYAVLLEHADFDGYCMFGSDSWWSAWPCVHCI